MPACYTSPVSGKKLDSQVLDCLRNLIEERGMEAQDIAVELEVEAEDIRRWAMGDLSGISLGHVGMLEKIASRPVNGKGLLELAPPKSGFSVGTTVTDAVLILEDRIQRLEDMASAQTDLMLQVIKLAEERKRRRGKKAESDSSLSDFSIQPDKWTEQLTELARDELIEVASEVMDELIKDHEEGQENDHSSARRPRSG